MEFAELANLSGRLFEGAGIVCMLLGVPVAAWYAHRSHRKEGTSLYTEFRHALGRAILLGLEFLVAADIILTVGETPTLRGVTVLAIIVLIRTFLSFTLEVELEGHWPWNKKPAPR